MARNTYRYSDVPELFDELFTKNWIKGSSKIVNQYPDGDTLNIEIDAPGCSRKDVNVTVKGDTIKVEIERKRGDTILSTFKDSFKMAKGVHDFESVDASVTHGVLCISLKYIKPEEPKKIEVKDIPVR